MSIRDGGAAFPSEGGHRIAVGNDIRKTLPSQGMSLRDYFAAQALTGMIAGAMSDGSNFNEYDAPIIAEAAYQMADALLIARNKND